MGTLFYVVKSISKSNTRRWRMFGILFYNSQESDWIAISFPVLPNQRDHQQNELDCESAIGIP